MQSFNQIIQNIRTTSINAKQAGTRIEVLILRWFLATPLYKVKRGWLWADFTKAVSKEGQDLGVDLVLEMGNGEFWTVQCKFCNQSSRIDEDKVAHFLGHQGWKFTLNSKTRTFSRFVWVDTDAVWGKNAEAYVHGRDNFTRLSMSVLASSDVDWDAIVNGKDAHIAPKKLRDYLKEVVHKAEAHFKNNDRGKVIMACGTGKTLTSQRIAEAVTGTQGSLILYCVPSIALLGQTYQSWAENASLTYPHCQPTADISPSPFMEREPGGEAYIIDKLRPVGKGNFTEFKYNAHIMIKDIPPRRTNSLSTVVHHWDGSATSIRSASTKTSASKTTQTTGAANTTILVIFSNSSCA